MQQPYPDSKDYYTLFWRVDTNGDGPYLSLRYYERFHKDNEHERTRHTQTYEALRQQAQSLIAAHPELGLDWDTVKGGYTGGYYESTVLSICLKDSLLDWKNAQKTVQKQAIAITDAFIANQ